MDDLQGLDIASELQERGYGGRELARRYHERFPWADLGALEATLRIREATASAVAAFARCLNAAAGGANGRP